MLINRVAKVLKKRIITGVLAFVIIISGVVGFKHQYDKINDLQYQLQLKQQKEERATDYTISSYDTKNIEYKFNEIREYKVFDSTVSMKHKYIYQDEAILGMHRKAMLTANVNIYFQYNVALANAEIKETNDTITITIPNAYLDKNTVCIVPNTFIRIEDECSHNILSGYETGRKLQYHWNESAIEQSKKDIEEYYKDSKKIEEYSKKQVRELVEMLTNKKIIVRVGE